MFHKGKNLDQINELINDRIEYTFKRHIKNNNSETTKKNTQFSKMKTSKNKNVYYNQNQK